MEVNQTLQKTSKARLFLLCLGVLLVCALVVYTQEIINIKTFLSYSLIDRIRITSLVKSTYHGDRLADIEHLRSIVNTSGITDNPYAYRLYTLALIARSDLYLLGHIQNEADIQCVDDTIARLLFKDVPIIGTQVINNTRSCLLKELETVWRYETPYVTNTEQFSLKQPAGEQYWHSARPLTPEVSVWRMMVPELELSKLPPPLQINSNQEKIELDQLLELQSSRTPSQASKILYWANPEGSLVTWFDIVASTTKSVSAPERLRFKTITAIASLNAFIEAWKLKYFYFAPRPFMRSAEIKPYIPTPNFPSYPSGHATVAGSILGSLSNCGFPADQIQTIAELAQESADSREWGGIHFRTDDVNGLMIGKQLGVRIAEKYCNR